ncbi:unnamed protein product [Cuscuta campestris]|uniref:Uncharacterized protein n=1 Tax=Cuscuta campestris TaxID=132261 RepID=A0A484LHB4_9ASTE|nr:unnamed protein product [Cuscuta campestris]
MEDDNPASSSNAGGDESDVLKPVPPSLEFSGGGGASPAENCGIDDWDGVLSDSVAASPGHEPLFRWIMGDVDDSSMVLQAAVPVEYDFNCGFPAMDQGFDLDLRSSGEAFIPAISEPSFPVTRLPNTPGNSPSMKFPASALIPVHPPGFNPDLLISRQQMQNPPFLMPFPYPQHEQSNIIPPPAKRQNRGTPNPAGSQIHRRLVSDPPPSHHFQLLPNFLAGEETVQLHQQQQQTIIDELFKTAELFQSGNPALAQAILARLNHHLSPIGNPFYRAAFYCKESLQSLLQSPSSLSSSPVPPFTLIFKIGAYKSFFEISPIPPFANFTCNQALLESLDGSGRIRIIDFDIGYGGHWASLMQELSLRSSGVPTLKITVIASPETHDDLELRLTEDNLTHFAAEINLPFQFEILAIDSLHLLQATQEAIAVRLPVSCFTTYQLLSVLPFVKRLSPKIVVSIDRACDRTDLLFPNQVIHALQHYTNLLESLDAVNVNLDVLQKVERFLVLPEMEKIVTGRFHSQEKTQNWKTAFLSSGFSPVSFSNFNESQVECVVKRTPVRGFHVEKKHSSLVLCWQRKELLSVSAWSC